ncbi:MAG: sterol desaturase family protein [Candidatus Sericytochromatia bacterium]|nr:sterol desaturase family protein [Candidatus Sericytochromatia bacterium]
MKVIKKEEIPWREVIFNINSGHVLMWFFRSAEVLVFVVILKNFSLNLLSNWSFIGQWLFTFFAWDCCFYWLHRMHHKIPLFWKVHNIHHQGEHFSLSLGLRNSWYSSLSSIPFFVILAVIGVPLPVFLSLSSVHYFFQFYNHNGVVKSSGILDKIMITPAHHRVHHGTNPEYRDRNFGGTLIIWDKLFGTFQKKIDGIDINYGLINPIRTDNPFWGNNLPFFKALKINVPDFKNDNNKIYIPDLIVGSGGFILLGLWLYYIDHEYDNLGIQQFYYFMLVFLSTIALGGMSDKKAWGIISWSLLTSILPLSFILYFNISDNIILSLFALFFIHGVYSLKYLFSNTKEKIKLEEAL